MKKMNVENIKDIKYNDDKFFFLYRVSAVIFNKEKTKYNLGGKRCPSPTSTKNRGTTWTMWGLME